MLTRRNAIEPFGQLDIRLVGGNREADVREAVQLVLNSRDDGWMAVAGVHHSDTAGKVDQPIVVGVGDDSPFGVHHRNGRYSRNPSWNGLGTPFQKRATLGAGDFGPELNDARHAAASGNE